MDKPLSANVFAILMLIVFIISFGLNTYILISPNFIVYSKINYIIIITLSFIGIIASILLLFSKNKSKNELYFSLIVLVPTVIFILNIIGRFLSLEIGGNIIIYIVIIIIFGLNRNFREYFDLFNKDKN